MRILPTLILAPLLALGLALVSGDAEAQARSGNFASTFEVVVDNCDGAGADLDKARVAITLGGPTLLVKIPALPDMKGKREKGSKLRAIGTKATEATEGKSATRAKFSFNGRIRRNKLQAVLVAEFFKGDKPQCTQSWSVSGTRSAK